MELKRIVVLANSIKKGGRCVAGRELATSRGASTGGWVRPVSDEPDGELKPRHMRTGDRRPLEVLDIVDVPLTRYAQDRIHPEDWIVDVASTWKRRSRLSRHQLAALEENPADLWLESRLHTDRVNGRCLVKRANHQSLYLIRPVNLRVELSIEHHSVSNKDRKRTRARFRYRGQEYRMNITDPAFTARYCTAFPPVGKPPLVIRPPFGDNCLLCVSLTPEFNGLHYKVVAAVLELP